MHPIRILAPSLLAFAVASCASQKANNYDTAAAGPVNAPVTEPANPVYDTPAAYEETGATTSTTTTTTTAPAAEAPGAMAAANTPAAAPSNGAAIIHTVVAGDTLSGISAKYKVPSATLKQANSMTTDTVVLGRKMVIPPTR